MYILFVAITFIFIGGIIFFGGRLLFLAGKNIFGEKLTLTENQGFRAYINYKNILPFAVLTTVAILFFFVDKSLTIQSVYYFFLLLALLLLGKLFQLLIWDNQEKIIDTFFDYSSELVVVGVLLVFFGGIVYVTVFNSTYDATLNDIAQTTKDAKTSDPFLANLTPLKKANTPSSKSIVRTEDYKFELMGCSEGESGFECDLKVASFAHINSFNPKSINIFVKDENRQKIKIKDIRLSKPYGNRPYLIFGVHFNRQNPDQERQTARFAEIRFEFVVDDGVLTVPFKDVEVY